MNNERLRRQLEEVASSSSLFEEGFLPSPQREVAAPSVTQLEALTTALEVEIVPFSELPAYHEEHRRTPSSRRLFIQRIGPLAMQQQNLDIKTTYTIEDHELAYLLDTDLPLERVAIRLGLPDAMQAKYAQNRLYYKICQHLRENGLDRLVAELTTAITEEHEDKYRTRNANVDLHHPGFAIDMLRYSRMRAGRRADLDEISASILGETAATNNRAVTKKSYDLRGFLLGQYYWRPPRVTTLLQALDVAEDRQISFMQLYTEIYERRMQEVLSRAHASQRENRVSRRESQIRTNDGSSHDMATNDLPMIRRAAARRSPFRRPLGENERKPPLNERREYIARIGPIALTHQVALSEHLSPREIKICLMVRDGLTPQQIRRKFNYDQSWVGKAIGYIVDKIHFALPEDKREDITANLRAEIARDAFQLQEPYPEHPGPRLNMLRHKLIAHGRGAPATLQSIANALNCQRNEVLDFFEGRRFMRPARVELILMHVGMPVAHHPLFMERYEKAYDAVWEDRRRRAAESKRKNRSKQA